MAHIDPTKSLDTLNAVSAVQLAAASSADIMIIVDGELRRISAKDLLQINETSTTTALADVAAAINTTGKYAGKQVWNTTTGVLCIADGPLAADTWSEADGTVEHSPV